MTQFRSVESPNWNTALWGTDTHLFNVTVVGSGLLPVTLVLHPYDPTGAKPPGAWTNGNTPGIYIEPRDNAFESGLIDPVTGQGRNASRWMGYRDSAGVFQPVTMDRVVRYVRWVLTQTQRWTADPNRVYVLGFSMGGGGTQKLVLHHPDLFAAGVSSAGWVDLASWTPENSDCKPGMRWRTATGPLCTDMHDSVYLVQNPQGARRPPLFLTWPSGDSIVSPARNAALIATMEAANHGHMSEWHPGEHQFFTIPNNPHLNIRLNVAPTIVAPTGSPTSNATGTRTNLGAGTPPVDSFTLAHSGITRDAVSNFAISPDGALDPSFVVTYPSNTTVTRFRLESSAGGAWDSDPARFKWFVGASLTATGQPGPQRGRSSSPPMAASRFPGVALRTSGIMLRLTSRS
jgi:dienelactone hydrolase